MKVLVVDFGSQYTHLIARRVRELGVYSEIAHNQLTPEDIGKDVGAVILSGGPKSVYEENSPKLRPDTLKFLLERDIPILGICYGHQLLAAELGGEVRRGDSGEYGITILNVLKDDLIMAGTPKVQKVWMSHRDKVVTLPDGAVVIARTRYSEIAAFRYGDKVYGVQFHPEVKHTEYGREILSNFLFRVAGLERSWSPEDLASEKVKRIKDQYRGGNVLIAASGGVDSTTAAVLTLRALGPDAVHLVVVDTGLLRAGEAEKVVRDLRKLGFKHVHLVNASSIFLSRLRGVTDPEEKRRVIARTFFEIFTEYAKKLEEEYGKFRYLVQGTIYPDRIESGRAGVGSARIKSHHNVTLTEVLDLELIEPINDLYKDEVRRLARALGIPDEIVYKHPFPGPGLAVRIVGEITPEKLRIARKAHSIVEEELKKAGLYRELWQAFPVVLPVRSVGVMGDERTYEYVVALRVVVSEDAMTAEFAKLPWNVIERIATRIVNEIEGVNRVVYDVTNKPPATIEYE